MILNTGKPRSVVGNAVSGAFFALILNAANSLESGYKAFADEMPLKDAEIAQKNGENSQKSGVLAYKKGKKSTAKALIKASLEGGIIAASGIAAANALGDKSKSPLNSTLSAIFCVGAGVAGLYAVNQLLNGEKFTLLSKLTKNKAPNNKALKHKGK